MADKSDDDDLPFGQPWIPPLKPIDKKAMGPDCGQRSGRGKSNKPKGRWADLRHAHLFSGRTRLPPKDNQDK